MAAPIQSMTGFASLEGEHEGVAIQVDARSVNGRSLDVRLRLPHGLDRHEAALRRSVAQVFRRGSVTLTVSLRRVAGGARHTVNLEQLEAYLEVIQGLAASGSVAAPRADGLLALKGVIETAAEEEATLPEAELFDAAHRALAALADGRREEGTRIVPILREQLAQMEHLCDEIDAHPERSLEAVKSRLHRQVSDLLDDRGLGAERLHQEAALLATRADIREEIDRLRAHVAAARALLDEGGPVGRKLDFLCQELNREANTICSKAPHHAITVLGLELKAGVEQMREQVQNLE